MAEERTVVEVELGVECHDIVILGDDERIDLREAAVLADKGPVEVHHELRDLANGIVREVHPVGHAARLERQQTDGRVDVLLENLVRHLSGDLLNLHAALLRAHHDDTRRLAVNDKREIVFLLDGRSGLDEQAVDALTGRARLMRDEDLAEELLRRFLDGFKRVDDLDASRLAAAARMDLRLDDDDIRAELSRILHGLLNRERRLARRDIDAVRAQDSLALIFVNIHMLSPIPVRCDTPRVSRLLHAACPALPCRA